MLHRKKILVVGDLILDKYIVGDVERISPEAPVPVLSNIREFSRPGGAANVAMNVASLGCEVLLFGYGKADSAMNELENLLSLGKVDFNYVFQEIDTITKTRIIAGTQQICRIDKEKKFILGLAQDELIDSILHYLPSCHALVISDYDKGAVTCVLCAKIIKACNILGIPVLVDPKDIDWFKYSGATVITPNEKELFPHNSYSMAKIDYVVITMGRKGIQLLYNRNDVHKTPYNSPARAKEVFDVSGAGDTVIATLAVCIANKVNIEQSVDIANIAAGIVVGKLGTSTVSLEELEAALPKKEKVIFTNGCFDILHPGHIKLLQEARALGDKLIVAIDSDRRIREYKGNDRPIYQLFDRVRTLTRFADEIYEFDTDEQLENMIKGFAPDVIVKGSNYKDQTIIGAQYVGEVHYVELLEGYSTTSLIEKIRC
jgi:D-beta-D-heptose 7-phosphate kinase / D-beta-D-heptose 1-phosphate adenosyltransferase